jgi:hypothetical protein
VHPKVARVLVGKGTVRYFDEPAPPAVVPVVHDNPAPRVEISADSASRLADINQGMVDAPNALDAGPGAAADAVDSGAQEPSVEISPRTGLPRRTYRRRDMASEG